MRWNKSLNFLCDPRAWAVASRCNNQQGLHPWQQKRREGKLNSLEILMFHTSTPSPGGQRVWLQFVFSFHGLFASPGPDSRWPLSSSGGCFSIFLLCSSFKTTPFRLLSWVFFCDRITGSRAVWRTQTGGCEGEQCGAGPRHPQRAEPDRSQQPGC